MARRLDDWLRHLEEAHPVKIDLGLERIREVARSMALLTPPFPVITVAGTNGKGSSVAMLDSMFTAAGARVGVFTSPHIHRYNERVRIAGREATDAALVAAFEAIEQARGEISLSYFEFGTLAALKLFHDAAVDIAVLEVGLGGRLDAVNIIDADVALITSIDIDHTHWLGETREAIAVEKAGIARAGRPVVVAEPDPPHSLIAHLKAIGARYVQAGEDFHYVASGDGWQWSGFGKRWDDLPRPALAGDHQLANAAGVIAVCHCLTTPWGCTRDGVARGLRQVTLAGRLERCRDGFEVVFDVAHNPAGMQALVTALANEPVTGRRVTLLGAMADKALPEMIAALAPVTDAWLLARPDTERAASSAKLSETLADILPEARMTTFETVPEAVLAARQTLGRRDRLLVTGSFYTVAEARARLCSGTDRM